MEKNLPQIVDLFLKSLNFFKYFFSPCICVRCLVVSHSGLRSHGSILQWQHRADLWVFGCFKSKGAQCFAPMKERRLLGLPSTVYHQITGATQIYQLNVMSLLKPVSTSVLLKWWSEGSGISVHLSVLPSEHARSP